MNRKLGGRPARSLRSAVRANPHDVVAPQSAFIHARRSNPHVTVRLANGEISAGRGRHAIPVDPLHRIKDLVAGVLVMVRIRHNLHEDARIASITRFVSPGSRTWMQSTPASRAG